MSIADNLKRISDAKAAIKTSIENKGVEVSDSALLDEYPALIDSIPMEGGDPFYEDLYNQRTSNGTNMSYLFYQHKNPELDVSKLDTSKVTNMSYMFHSCEATELDLSNWDTSKVTTMSYMFYSCKSQVKLGNWDLSKLTNTTYMFQYFNNGTKYIDLSALNFNNVSDASYMFANCYLNYVDIKNLNFDFSKTKKVENMFKYITSNMDLSNWDITGLTTMYNMFYDYNGKKLDLTNWVTTSITNMGNTFSSCDKLEELIIPDWDMTNVTSSSSMFSSSNKLKYVDASRCNATTLTKLASLLPTKTQAAYGTIVVPEDISQETYDALVAKYWASIGAAMAPAPTSYNIVAELDEIMLGDNTKVYLGAYEPWDSDPSKVELVLASDSSIATMTEDNEVVSTGVLGDIVVEVRIKDTQEVIGTKTIPVTETDSYPSLVKFRVASTPSSYDAVITVNGSAKKLSDLTYDKYSNVYSFDAGVPITSIKFGDKINELVKINTSNVTEMSNIFSGNTSKSLDVSRLDTSNVTRMYKMFGDCTQLKTLDLSNFNTSNVTSMNNMFNNCANLTQLDVSNWNTSNVTAMGNMFDGCVNLTSLDISNWDMTNIVSVSDMFKNCTSLHTLRLDNFNYRGINKIVSEGNLPANRIEVDGEEIPRIIYCKGAEAGYLTPPKGWIFNYIDGVIPDTSIPLYVPGEFSGNTEITEVKTMVNNSHTDLESMFGNCTNLVSVNAEDWDTRNVTDMYRMFYGCSNLTSLDLSNFDTSNVTSMNSMFYGCNNLTSLDVSNFDTSNVINMGFMFRYCRSLTSIDLSNFNTSNVTSMGYMFDECRSLTSLDLSNFDTSKVTDMTGMFVHCENLEELDIRNFDLIYEENNVYAGTKIDISTMLLGCNKLKVLHLENCSTATVVHLLESSGLPARENNDGIMYMSADAYQGAKNIVPSGWTIFTE